MLIIEMVKLGVYIENIPLFHVKFWVKCIILDKLLAVIYEVEGEG